jgi:alpha-1,2-glucosyltransferase
LLAVLALGLGALAVRGAPLLSDETHHYSQISVFLEGGSRVIDSLTMFPTYHALLAGFARLLGASTLDAMRALSTLLSALLLIVTWRIARYTAPEEVERRTLQVLFMPLLFPLLFLVYTDVLSLLCVCAAVLLTLRRSFLAAGLLAAAAVAVRQSNVVWLGMLWGMCVIELGGAVPSWRLARRVLRETWTFGLGAAGFVAFVVWNGGVALGDSEMHPSFGLHTENVYFMLLLFFVFFLPLCLLRSPEAYALLRRPWVVLAAGLGVLVFFVTFEADHPYNQMTYAWFLHNRILHALSASPIAKVLFVAAALLAALAVAATPLTRGSQYLLYPATVASLLPFWHVEQRYYLIPFVLFILFRRSVDAWVDRVTLAVYIAASVILLHGITSSRFFL